MHRRIWLTVKISRNLGLLLNIVPWLYQCIFKPKGSYGNGDPKNTILDSVQKAHFAVRACKMPVFMQRRIWPTLQISRNSGLLLTMVPLLHQCILYIKRKLPECRTQKCNPWFGAKSALCRTGLQITQFHAAPYTAYSADFPKVGNSFNHGTVIAPMHSLHQKEATGMKKPKM